MIRIIFAWNYWNTVMDDIYVHLPIYQPISEPVPVKCDIIWLQRTLLAGVFAAGTNLLRTYLTRNVGCSIVGAKFGPGSVSS